MAIFFVYVNGINPSHVENEVGSCFVRTSMIIKNLRQTPQNLKADTQVYIIACIHFSHVRTRTREHKQRVVRLFLQLRCPIPCAGKATIDTRATVVARPATSMVVVAYTLGTDKQADTQTRDRGRYRDRDRDRDRGRDRGKVHEHRYCT